MIHASPSRSWIYFERHIIWIHVSSSKFSRWYSTLPSVYCFEFIFLCYELGYEVILAVFDLYLEKKNPQICRNATIIYGIVQLFLIISAHHDDTIINEGYERRKRNARLTLNKWRMPSCTIYILFILECNECNKVRLN